MAYDRSRFHYSSLRANSHSNYKEEIDKELIKASSVGKRNYIDFQKSNKNLSTKLSEQTSLKGEKKVKLSQVNDPKQTVNLDFRKIITCSDEDLIAWRLKVGILKKPTYCKVCRNKTGKIRYYKLNRYQAYYDNFVLVCKKRL